MAKIAEKITEALNGYHTEVGPFGHSVLSAKVWSKNGKTRIYVDRRHVGTDGRINPRVQGNGFIEVLPAGDLTYSLRLDDNEIRCVVDATIRSLVSF